MKLTTRARRFTVAITGTAAAAGLAIGMSTLAQAAPASRAAPSITPVCQTHGLVIWLNTNGSGTAGTTFYRLNFTNLSGHACTLEGFPFVTAVNLSGHQVGNRAIFNHIHPVHVVTLGRGKTVRALLGVRHTANFPASKCHPVTAAGFRVFPPTGVSAGSKLVPFPFSACSTRGAHAPNFLSIGPV